MNGKKPAHIIKKAKPTIIKKSVRQDPSIRMVAKTLAGLEEILRDEIREAGGKKTELLTRAVAFEGDLACMYKVNYTCRTALRVLKIIGIYQAGNEHELYQRILEVDWSDYISTTSTFAVDAFVSNSKITNSHYASQKVKDAIADQFRRKTGERPSVDIENPDLRINLHLNGDQATLSIDSSGESLHKRGYRRWQGEAPLNEVLAAGMIMLSGWRGQTPLYDPMCGSGTLLTEAAMIAGNVPCGYFREKFGFMNWRDFDSAFWKKVQEEADAKITAVDQVITGSDVNQKTLALMQQNMTKGGFEEVITLRQVAFEDGSPPDNLTGTIITNPPYGERLQKQDLNAFYKMIGDVLKQKYAGWDVWLITSDYNALKSVGLRTSRKIKLYNGPLECRFVKYEMYEGTRKNKTSGD